MLIPALRLLRACLSISHHDQKGAADSVDALGEDPKPFDISENALLTLRVCRHLRTAVALSLDVEDAG
jgi:hypothetical protein